MQFFKEFCTLCLNHTFFETGSTVDKIVATFEPIH